MKKYCFSILLFCYSCFVFADAAQNLVQLAGDDPMVVFNAWQKIALEAQTEGSNYAALATIDDQNRPTQRLIYIQTTPTAMFHFYTHKQSNMVQQIAKIPSVSVLFSWPVANLGHIQIKLYGKAVPIAHPLETSHKDLIDYQINPALLQFSIQRGNAAQLENLYIIYRKDAEGKWQKKQLSFSYTLPKEHQF